MVAAAPAFIYTIRMELPEFAKTLPQYERAFGELALHSLVAVYMNVGEPERTELHLATCGEVVGLPENGDELSAARHYVSITPLGDNGEPKPHEFGKGVEVTKIFFKPSPQFPFRFFELQRDQSIARD